MEELVRNTKDKGFAVLLQKGKKFRVDYQPRKGKRINKSFSTKAQAMKYYKGL